jgi:hypothetical protein
MPSFNLARSTSGCRRFQMCARRRLPKREVNAKPPGHGVLKIPRSATSALSTKQRRQGPVRLSAAPPSCHQPRPSRRRRRTAQARAEPRSPSRGVRPPDGAEFAIWVLSFNRY